MYVRAKTSLFVICAVSSVNRGGVGAKTKTASQASSGDVKRSVQGEDEKTEREEVERSESESERKRERGERKREQQHNNNNNSGQQQ